jgi:hypothetical protein
MGALVGGGIAAVLSLLVLSRVIGDNPLYRIAQHLLIGAALGYAAAVLVGQTLVPTATLAAAGDLEALIVGSLGLLLGLMLAGRFGRQRLTALANIPLAILFGVGAAIALVGAARGTIVPLLLDTIAIGRLTSVDPATIAGTVVVIITVAITLIAFGYTQRGEQPSGATRAIRSIGRTLVLATFGVFLAAAVTTYVTALVTQVQAIADWLTLIATSL